MRGVISKRLLASGLAVLCAWSLEASAYEALIAQMREGQEVSQAAIEQFARAAVTGEYNLAPEAAIEGANLLQWYGYTEAGAKMLQDIANSVSPRYVGAETHIFDGDLARFTYQDPPGGQDFQKIVTSCFYRSGNPTAVAEPKSQYLTRLDPPAPITAGRRIKLPKNEYRIDSYRFDTMAIPFDENAHSSSRFNAYFFGYKIGEEHYGEQGSSGYKRVSSVQAKWHAFSCHPKYIKY